MVILSGNVNNATHYDILGVKEDASYEEIRTSYRSAILSSHPDKLQKAFGNSNPKHKLDDKFLEVQRAWEVLGDPSSRARYDNELRSLRQDDVTADDISLEDFMVEDGDDVLELSYNCRCGDQFCIDSMELADMGYPLVNRENEVSLLTTKSAPASIILPCGSCSLKVRLLINPDTQFQTDRHL